MKIDCGVIGGGFAGCSAALELADGGKKVHLFVKGNLMEDCNSYLTAGGLAAVPLVNNVPLGSDSFEKHEKETLGAGKGLNDKKVVKFCAEHFFSEVIQWLIDKGVKFDKSEKGYEYSLHAEGGHSENRVFHFKDTTGIEIMRVLGKLTRAHKNIVIHENHMAIDLATSKKGKKTTCLGFYVYDIDNKYVKSISCDSVFVATGGLGKVFSYTSNKDIATGDGFAMCYRAGLPLINMEFIQFHPSVYYDPSMQDEKERRFLLTEALRGSGAIIKISKDSKKDCILKHHPLGSKATRDIVTRAEDAEMRKHGLKHLWLDCTNMSKDKLKKEFKNSYEFCLSKGIDLSKESVPIVYAVHYSNGGVMTDMNGSTEIKGCYVVGEVAYTGLNGATRLASNSAPECILFGRTAAKYFLEEGKKAGGKKVPSWDEGNAVEVKDKITLSYYWDIIRMTMTSLCGISRNKERMSTAREVLGQLHEDINDFYWKYKLSSDFLEIRNIIDVAIIILDGALLREESRASHFREDFPEQDDKRFKKLTFVKKDSKPSFRKV
ncbi:FAD-binding protein [archaeon]|nr:FAD-binding protein [archaeon]MBT7239344.1 FAD-binding protein [archaeon]